jgi:hypothetical protein
MNPWTVRIDYGLSRATARTPAASRRAPPQRPVLFAVDQQLGEGPRLRVPPELADPVGSLEVGEHEDVEQLGAGSWPKRVETLP